ncbi:hypothetical protein COV19_03535 [Candidatus Woesearchaeota archaeon CG10_big_fil_rev_8_21_14_0_10_44_13]|nr:MAG: hypothetical protein COV19_03535 [Candidatus Woesearchaeota archaeon CG10_big_fil_rev_8_21_14_0_10_44_13]
MIIATLFLRAIDAAVRKAERSRKESGNIKKALSEIKEPGRKYNESFSPYVTSRNGNVIYADFKKGKGYDPTIPAFNNLEKAVAKERSKIEQPSPSLPQRISTAMRNLPTMASNAFNNTLGYPIVLSQNYRTEGRTRKHPEEPVGYIKVGLGQTMGAGWKTGRAFRKRHINPYHLPPEHYRPPHEQHRHEVRHIQKFIKKAKIVDPEKRNDLYTGHSSGGNAAIYAAGDHSLYKLGIKHIQAVAPTPYGIRADRLSHKLMGTVVDLSVDDVSKSKIARENALKMYHRVPLKDPTGKHGIKSIHIIAGAKDGLVSPRETYYKHADKQYVIRHPKSTHFGTSGSNNEINEIIADLAAMQVYGHKKKEYRRAA